MAVNLFSPSDAFCCDEMHLLCVSPYSIPVRSKGEFSLLCRGKNICFLDGGDDVAETLRPVIAGYANYLQIIPFPAVGKDGMRRVLREVGTDDAVLVLGCRQYQDALTSLCSVIERPTPVVIPTGFLVLAVPGAQYVVQKGACVCYAELGKMLARFRGERLLVWSHGPAARYVFLPALAELGMLKDVVGVVGPNDGNIVYAKTRFSVREPGEWIRGVKPGAVLIPEDAASAAFCSVHSLLPDYTPLLMGASRMGVLDSFHSVAASHAVFTGPSGLLKADRPAIVPAPPLARDYYEKLYRGSPHRSTAHYESITTWSQNSLLGSGFSPADLDSPYVHCAEGFRRTAFQPESWDSSVHVFGASVVFGAFADDEGTVPSQLQQLCNQAFASGGLTSRFKVVNHGANASSPLNCYRKMSRATLHPGDHVVFLSVPFWPRTEPDSFVEIVDAMHHLCISHGAIFSLFLLPELMFAQAPSGQEEDIIAAFRRICGEISGGESYPVLNPSLYEDVLEVLRESGVFARSLQTCFERPHEFGDLFIDISHISVTGMGIVAREVFEQRVGVDSKRRIDLVFRKGLKEFARISRDVMLSSESFISFLEDTPRMPNKEGIRCGAAVMNCNPFTLGHRHLVESALCHVDQLYIFVVEEDQSFFSIDQRLEMVRAGVSEFGDRVLVTPSGSGLISSVTFPEYFTKEAKRTNSLDVTLDGLIFGSLICKEFSIQCRFFGSEPYCEVTREYMDQTVQLLELFGVDCHIIPRMERKGQAVSATHVRNLYRENDIDLACDLVPESTLRFLKAYIRKDAEQKQVMAEGGERIPSL